MRNGFNLHRFSFLGLFSSEPSDRLYNSSEWNISRREVDDVLEDQWQYDQNNNSGLDDDVDDGILENYLPSLTSLSE